MASSFEEGEVPFDKFAAATRVSELVRVITRNKNSPKAVAAARAEGLSLSQALGRNAARMEQESSSIENPTVAAAAAVPGPRNKVPLETLDDALAIVEAFFGRAPEKEKLEKKKYRRVRLSKVDLEYILSYKSSPMPHSPDASTGGLPPPKSRLWTTSSYCSPLSTARTMISWRCKRESTRSTRRKVTPITGSLTMKMKPLELYSLLQPRGHDS
jgi:hypothetical protein